jgi:CII-binding regulator of phage lambda lysogenization HflD
MNAASDGTGTRTKVTMKEGSSYESEPPIPKTPVRPILPTPVTDLTSEEFDQRIASLRADILALQQKLDTLKHELARIKRENIRPPELAVIQMQVQLLASDSSLAHITDLINKYAEAMHAVTALRAVCRNTEKRIVQEGQIRECLLREVEKVGSFLLASEFAGDPIRLPTALAAESPEDITILTRQLELIQADLSENIESDPSVYLTAFQDFLSFLKTDAALQMLGTDGLRIEALKLQKKLDKQAKINESIARRISDLRQSLQNFQEILFHIVY